MRESEEAWGREMWLLCEELSPPREDFTSEQTELYFSWLRAVYRIYLGDLIKREEVCLLLYVSVECENVDAFKSMMLFNDNVNFMQKNIMNYLHIINKYY